MTSSQVWFCVSQTSVVSVPRTARAFSRAAVTQALRASVQYAFDHPVASRDYVRLKNLTGADDEALRAAQSLMLATRARALVDGRPAPSLDDVRALAEPVLKHRMSLTFAARAEGDAAGAFAEASATRKLIPPIGGVDITPIIWFGIVSLARELLLGQQGLLRMI